MRSVLFACALMLCAAILSAAEVAPTTRPAMADCRLSGPYTHGNLTVFLIHGPDRMKGKEFLTLGEAMEKKLVVVHETSNVNELAIENTGSTDVYVQSGDIVKGGKQDRTIAMDFIVPAKSGKLPIASFCVEHGRWQQRGNENVAEFMAGDVVAGKELKLAVRGKMDQQQVWDEGATSQKKLSETLVTQLLGGSGGSLQLAQEDKKVKESSQEYEKALAGVVEGKNDVIGYAFAINGKVNSADIYGSNVLFKKLWPKLLKANAIEAIAELQEDKFKPASPESARGFLSEAEKAKGSDKDVNARVNLLTREDDENILFETRDRAQKGAWIHRNYIKKN